MKAKTSLPPGKCSLLPWSMQCTATVGLMQVHTPATVLHEVRISETLNLCGDLYEPLPPVSNQLLICSSYRTVSFLPSFLINYTYENFLLCVQTGSNNEIAYTMKIFQNSYTESLRNERIFPYCALKPKIACE